MVFLLLESQRVKQKRRLTLKAVVRELQAQGGHALEESLTAIINVRNGETYLPLALASLRAQTRQVKILLVDNQSSDSTEAIATEFPDVEYHRTEAPLTLGEARQYSLRFLKTPYVAWLDCDDYWEPSFAEKTVRALDSDTNAVMATTGTLCIDDKGKPLPRWEHYQRKYFVSPSEQSSLVKSGDSFRQILIRLSPRWAWCAHVFRSEVVQSVNGFDTRLVYSEDLDLILKVLRKGYSIHIPQNLTRYRRHPNQETKIFTAEKIHGEKQEVIERHLRDTQASYPDPRTLSHLTQLKCQISRTLKRKTLGNAVSTLKMFLNAPIVKYVWKWLSV